MRYRFQTTCTMKPYNNKKYWIDGNYVRQTVVPARDLKSALKIYCDKLEKKYYISISKTALKNKEPMYRDGLSGPEQVGYVITGKTDIEDSAQYIDLWVEITTVDYPKEFNN